MSKHRNGHSGVSKGVSRRSSGVGRSLMPQQPKMAEETAFCAYCQQPFQRSVGSKRKFCKPSSERKLNWERKWALAGALARQFRRWKWRANDLLAVAKRCIETAYEAVMTAMIKLGWKYDQARKVWRMA